MRHPDIAILATFCRIVGCWRTRDSFAGQRTPAAQCLCRDRYLLLRERMDEGPLAQSDPPDCGFLRSNGGGRKGDVAPDSDRVR